MYHSLEISFCICVVIWHAPLGTLGCDLAREPAACAFKTYFLGSHLAKHQAPSTKHQAPSTHPPFTKHLTNTHKHTNTARHITTFISSINILYEATKHTRSTKGTHTTQRRKLLFFWPGKRPVLVVDRLGLFQAFGNYTRDPDSKCTFFGEKYRYSYQDPASPKFISQAI